jgi:hypothetical protein
MNDIYLNERTGEKWELVPNIGTGHDEELVIKPVQKAEKIETYRLRFDAFDSVGFLVNENYQFTDSQGKAVAEAIRKLMEFVNTPDGDHSDKLHELRQATRAARTAVQAKDKETR